MDEPNFVSTSFYSITNGIPATASGLAVPVFPAVVRSSQMLGKFQLNCQGGVVDKGVQHNQQRDCLLGAVPTSQQRPTTLLFWLSHTQDEVQLLMQTRGRTGLRIQLLLLQ